MAWYSGNPYERARSTNRATGPYALGVLDDGDVQRRWCRSSCGSDACATSVPALFVLSILVNVGMWFERFVIIVTSLHRSYLPSSWVDVPPDVRSRSAR